MQYSQFTLRDRISRLILLTAVVVLQDLETSSFRKSKESRKNGPTVQIFDLAIPKDVLHARIATAKAKLQDLVTLDFYPSNFQR